LLTDGAGMKSHTASQAAAVCLESPGMAATLQWKLKSKLPINDFLLAVYLAQTPAHTAKFRSSVCVMNECRYCIIFIFGWWQFLSHPRFPSIQIL
jgi:hypothetical protein